jgi:DNA-damage-inducible protein J
LLPSAGRTASASSHTHISGLIPFSLWLSAHYLACLRLNASVASCASRLATSGWLVLSRRASHPLYVTTLLGRSRPLPCVSPLANRLHFAIHFGIFVAGQEVFVMARTSNIFARVEPEVKEQAELILEQLGIPMSNAIRLFLKQIVLQRGIPFELKLPQSKPLSVIMLTEEQFNTEIENGLADVAAGRVVSAENVADRMRRDYGI